MMAIWNLQGSHRAVERLRGEGGRVLLIAFLSPNALLDPRPHQEAEL